MQEFSNVITNIIKDIGVEFSEQYKENFRKKSFFNQAWKRSKTPKKTGSLMIASGALRNSIRYSRTKNSISFFSKLAYSSIHNDGGEITVTRKMKRFFWAMYYKHSKKITKLVVNCFQITIFEILETPRSSLNKERRCCELLSDYYL